MMSKQEFLDGLRRSLTGGLESQEVNEHIRYYSDYIDTQIRMGKSEEMVMNSLGEPRLIAKTLLGMENVETVTEEFIDDDSERTTDEKCFRVKGKTIRLPGWLFTILVCVVSFCALTIVFALVANLMPIFILVMMGVFLYRMFRNLF